ncbi:hypothetical protein D3C85_826370 [compost metagenome]
MSALSHEYVSFKSAISNVIDLNGDIYLKGVSQSASTHVVWLHHIKANLSTGVADRLIDSSISSLKEVGGCLSLGLVRPALFAMRTELELALSWVFFNDHPVEWSHIEKYPEDYPLRATNIKYMKAYNSRYDSRMSLLEKAKIRPVSDPYGLLSAYVHGTSAHAAPATSDLCDIVMSKNSLDDCVKLQASVSEYISDVFASWFADTWHDWPEEAKANVSGRLSDAQLKAFCTA